MLTKCLNSGTKESKSKLQWSQINLKSTMLINNSRTKFTGLMMSTIRRWESHMCLLMPVKWVYHRTIMRLYPNPSAKLTKITLQHRSKSSVPSKHQIKSTTINRKPPIKTLHRTRTIRWLQTSCTIFHISHTLPTLWVLISLQKWSKVATRL